MTETAAEGATPSTGATPAADPPASTASVVVEPDMNDLSDGARRAIAALRTELRSTTESLTAERDAALAQLQEHEDAQGTEVEQLRTKLGRVEKENGDLKAELAERDRRIAASDAASKHGIPDWADRLKGSTPEELDADAQAIAERVNGEPARTTPDFGAGARQGTQSSGMDQLIRRKAGR